MRGALRRLLLIGATILGESLSADTFEQAKIFSIDGHRPNELAVTDLNGDGRDDVIAADTLCDPGDCAFAIWFQRPNGELANPVTYPILDDATAMQVADFTGDRRPDIALAFGFASRMSIYPQNADGTFGTPATFETPSGYDLAMGDINRDGREDLILKTWGQGVSIFEQQPAGGFLRREEALGGNGYDDVEIADVDADGFLDLLNFSIQGPLAIILRRGTAQHTFLPEEKIDVPGNPLVMSPNLEVADFTGDGRRDLVIGMIGRDGFDHLEILSETAGKRFELAADLITTFNPDNISVADIDGDGDADVTIDGGAALFDRTIDYAIEVFVQVAPLVFREELYRLGPFGNFFAHDSMRVGDLNGDGRRDLVVAHDGGFIAVYYGGSQRRRAVHR